MINEIEKSLEYLTRDELPNALSLSTARAIASREIQDEMVIRERCFESGILGADEIEYLLANRVVLPFPYIPHHYPVLGGLSSPENYLFSDAFYDTCIDHANNGDNVYFLSGNFSLFTVGHLSLMLQLQEQRKNDRKNGKDSLIAILVENDLYSNTFKLKPPLLPSIIRTSWFRDFPSTVTSIWPLNYSNGETHWETEIARQLGGLCNVGTAYLFDSLEPNKRKNISMVIPQFPISRNEDHNLVQERERQLIGSGFSIYKPVVEVTATTTSVLSERFKIKPLSMANINLVVEGGDN